MLSRAHLEIQIHPYVGGAAEFAVSKCSPVSCHTPHGRPSYRSCTLSRDQSEILASSKLREDRAFNFQGWQRRNEVFVDLGRRCEYVSSPGVAESHSKSDVSAYPTRESLTFGGRFGREGPPGLGSGTRPPHAARARAHPFIPPPSDSTKHLAPLPRSLVRLNSRLPRHRHCDIALEIRTFRR